MKGGCFRWSLRNGLSGCEAGSETKGSKGLSHTCRENSDCRWEQLTCSENGQEPAWLERGQCEAEQEMRSGRSAGPVPECLWALWAFRFHSGTGSSWGILAEKW